MKTAIKLTVITIITLFVAGAVQAYAQPSCFTMVERIPGITLDDAQRSALTEKDADHRKKMIRLRADYQVARVDKQNLIKDRNFKKDAVKKQIESMVGIQKEKELARLDALDDLRKVLTDEQWAVFTAHTAGAGMDARCPGMRGAFHKGKGGQAHGKGEGGFGPRMGDCPFTGPAAAQ
ncbi:hypothetical protein JCM14469_11150 [Desulfatiferula olefinivorans]